MEQDVAKARQIALPVFLGLGLGGFYLIMRGSRRLGSANDQSADWVPQYLIDGLLVAAILIAGLIVTFVVFVIAGRRSAETMGTAGLISVVVIGAALSCGAAAIVYQSKVVEFAEPLLTVSDARTVLDEVITGLSETGPQPPPRLPSGSELSLDALPDPAAMVASVVRSEPEVCRDSANRDTGSVWLSWGFSTRAFVPPSALAVTEVSGIPQSQLPPDYLGRFRDMADSLRALGFAVSESTQSENLTGTRSTPPPRGGDLPLPDAYAVDLYAGIATFYSRPGATAVDMAFRLVSPCVKPAGPT
ncbi:MAG: hypothetical protein ABR540_06810 [Acidimicrobiales bacterium]